MGWIRGSLALMSLVVGCSSAPPCSTSCPIGAACTASFDCASHNCSPAGTCEAGCDDTSDCGPGEACITAGEGRFLCSATCEGNRDFIGAHPGLVCEGGAVIACSAATDPGAQCDACGCEAGETCNQVIPDFGCELAGSCACVVPGPVGAACTSHGECASGNCSGTLSSTGPRVCQVAAGATCTTGDTTCVRCDLPGSAGTPVCRQSCDGTIGCPGGQCLGNRTTMEFGCFTDCTDDPSNCFVGEHCEYVTGSTTARYCAPD